MGLKIHSSALRLYWELGDMWKEAAYPARYWDTSWSYITCYDDKRMRQKKVKQKSAAVQRHTQVFVGTGHKIKCCKGEEQT